MRLHYLQHVPFEDLAFIANWAAEKDIEITCTRLFDSEPLPSQDSFDWLVVMGGPMNVDECEKYPWLAKEVDFIAEAIGQGKRVLGICLGGQLIAKALGAKVVPNTYKEIGWFPVTKTSTGKKSELFGDLPDVFMAFHWHGDRFEIPEGCEPILESAACSHQAFQKGDRVLAMQFHLETTPPSVFKLIEHCAEEVIPGPFIQNSEVMTETVAYFDDIQDSMRKILDRMLACPAKK